MVRSLFVCVCVCVSLALGNKKLCNQHFQLPLQERNVGRANDADGTLFYKFQRRHLALGAQGIIQYNKYVCI